MRRVQEIRFCGAGISTACLWMLWSTAAATEPAWTAEIYKENRRYVEVTVDTSALRKNTHLENVSFDLELFDDAGNQVGTLARGFTDAKVKSLGGPVQHVRYYALEVPRVARASGMLHWELWTDGAKQDGDGPDSVQMESGSLQSATIPQGTRHILDETPTGHQGGCPTCTQNVMSSMTLEPGINRNGGDLEHERMQSLQECSDRCRGNPRCLAFTFVMDTQGGVCWLKQEVPHMSSCSSCTSGVKRTH